MPVFTCNSCGRILFRPDELLGRAWQCLTCGPTVVSEEPVIVTAELAALLEKEYQLSLAFPQLMVIGAPTVAVRPRDDKPVVFGRKIDAYDLSARQSILGAIGGMVISASLLTCGAFVAMTIKDGIYWVMLIVIFATPVTVIIYVLAVLIISAINRRLLTKAVDTTLTAIRAANRDADQRSSSVSPEPHKKTEYS